MRVLIADDNEVTLVMLRSKLEIAGYEVIEARDGAEALEQVRSGASRLVISDWEMPRMSGIDLCRAVRAEELHGYVYVILLTSHDTPAARVDGLSAGADDFVAKPYDAPELLARVRSGERVLSLETRDVAIFALAKLAESRDPDTGAHLERVRNYSRILAQRLATIPRFHDQIDPEYIRLIYQTSPLHDIGKVGIPDSVLLKPGKLTPEEFEVMKTHAALGAQTLDAAVTRFPEVRFLKLARDIAQSHHERVDGKGYPDGLAGDEIPLCARIVALADVYDALTTKRVYKEAYSHAQAKATILRESGAHFDPLIVEAFLHEEKRFLDIKRRFAFDARAAA
jgi:putative two-component system response regulator